MKIDIITPCYNQFHYIPRCIRSTMDQLLEGERHIIINDGSVTPEVLQCEAFCQNNPHYALLHNTERNGVSRARNRGIQESNADWIKFIDADDLLAPYTLNLLRNIPAKQLETTHVVIGAQMKVVDGLFRQKWLMENPVSVMGEWNPFLPSMAFVRRSTLEELNGFNEEIEFEEDWDLWLRIWKRYGDAAFLTVDYPVCYYWIDQEERKVKFQPNREIQGIPIREYFRQTYGITPHS